MKRAVNICGIEAISKTGISILRCVRFAHLLRMSTVPVHPEQSRRSRERLAKPSLWEKADGKAFVKWLLAISIIFPILFSTSLMAQRADLDSLKFCIDPGHGGFLPCNDRHVIPDVGTDFWESESNFRKALLLKSLLEARGATVYLTRSTNDSTTVYPVHPTDCNNDPNEPSLSARWQLANANNVNWFHSIHSNAFNGSTNYTLVLLKENITTRQAQFPEALTMSDAMYRRIRERNRTGALGGVRLDYTFYGGTSGGFNLGVLKGLAMPGQLSEGSFHDYYPETRRLMNNDYRKNEAYGILNGFLEYYGVPFDTLGIIAGIQTNSDNNKPQNGTKVRLLPENLVYSGDAYNNGYFFFDSLHTGPHTVRFETPGFALDSATTNVVGNGMHFVDRILGSLAPPIVIQTQPAMNDTNFDVLKTVEITFSKAMDTASVRAAFSIVPSVSGTLSWKSGNSGLVFAAAKYFRHLTNYQVTIGGTAKTVTGLFMDGNGDGTPGDAYVLSFKTQAPIPPIVAQTVPRQGDTTTAVTASIGVRFSKTMDTTSIRAAFSITPSVAGSFLFTTNNSVLFYNHSSNLDYNTSYTLRIEGSALSIDSVAIDGNKDNVPGDAFVLTFRTEQSPSGVVSLSNVIPTEYALGQNFPNPFNPRTEIMFALPFNSRTSLKIFDVLGREVAMLVDDNLGAGRYKVSFDASSLPSGVYFYRIVASEFSAVKKMMLTK